MLDTAIIIGSHINALTVVNSLIAIGFGGRILVVKNFGAPKLAAECCANNVKAWEPRLSSAKDFIHLLESEFAEDERKIVFLTNEAFHFALRDAIVAQAVPNLVCHIGDAGLISSKPCSCGRRLSRIIRIDGRVNDFLLTTDGNPISGVIATHSFRHVVGADFYQFIQNEPGQVTVRIVANSKWERTREEDKIREILRGHLGGDAHIDFEYPHEIEKTPAGKAKFVINRCLDNGAPNLAS